MRMITSILVALTFMWVGVNDTLAQGLHFGVKGGVLGQLVGCVTTLGKKA